MNQLIQYLINYPSDEFTISERDLKDINDFYTPLHAFKHLIPETPTSTLENYVFSHDKVIEKFSAVGFEVRYNDLKREFYIRKPNKKQIIRSKHFKKEMLEVIRSSYTTEYTFDGNYETPIELIDEYLLYNNITKVIEKYLI